MKKYTIFLFLTLCFVGLQAANDYKNLALHLDGEDNNIRMGMDTIHANWTLEAWIKSDNNAWKELEVLIGGGEYSDLNIADIFPLVIKKGRLHSSKVNLTAPDTLDNQWHHVAATCNANGTALYVDGQEVARNQGAAFILPGTIGVADIKYTFRGMIDEVRIWRISLPADVIRRWMNGPLESDHPYYSKLKGYYNFDDMHTEAALNWVGKGHQAYHLRNGRNKYKGTEPLAFAVSNDNPAFKNSNARQRLFNAVEVQGE